MWICAGTLKEGYGGEVKNEINLSSVIRKSPLKAIPQHINMHKEAAVFNDMKELLQHFRTSLSHGCSYRE